MQVIGIDISKRWMDVAWQYDQCWHNQRLPVNPEGWRQLLSILPGERHYVLEATGNYHLKTAMFLHAADQAVSVVNPLVIKRFAQIAQLDSWLDDLKCQHTRSSNPLESQHYQSCPNRLVCDQIQTQRQLIQRQIRTCEQQLEVLVRQGFSAVYERLLSIPGIGPTTASKLIADTDGFRRFCEVKSLVAYVGLSSRVSQSGSRVRSSGGITKMGAGRLRQLLYLCSWTAKRCNPACARLAERLQQKGKPAKVINIAVAHKLLRQAFAVATKEEYFAASCA